MRHPRFFWPTRLESQGLNRRFTPISEMTRIESVKSPSSAKISGSDFLPKAQHLLINGITATNNGFTSRFSP